MRLARETLRRHGVGGDVHAPVAARLVAEGLLPVVDIGCGEGELRRHLPAGTWVGVDSSQTMVAGAPAGARLARADALPFSAGSFGAAALLYVLYHLDDPATALPDRPLTFDAETTPGLMAEHFA